MRWASGFDFTDGRLCKTLQLGSSPEFVPFRVLEARCLRFTAILLMHPSWKCDCDLYYLSSFLVATLRLAHREVARAPTHLKNFALVVLREGKFLPWDFLHIESLVR